MDNKRKRKEWHDAILSIIQRHGGRATYRNFYPEIPEILQLTERELKPSTVGANYEFVWRGTLRGYLSHMVQEGIIYKDGTGNFVCKSSAEQSL